MRFNEKQCRYTSLLVTLCIILSCLVSYTSTISTPFIDQAASVHSEEAIYNLSITSSGEDICTPEMLGRQELISRPEISHTPYIYYFMIFHKNFNKKMPAFRQNRHFDEFRQFSI